MSTEMIIIIIFRVRQAKLFDPHVCKTRSGYDTINELFISSENVKKVYSI